MHVRKVGAGLAAAGMLGGTLLLTGAAPAVAQPDGTLRVIGVTTEEGGDEVDSVGDSFAFGGDVFAASRTGRKVGRSPIGRFGVSCTITSAENFETQCLGTVSIDRRRGDEGQITVQGLIADEGGNAAGTIGNIRREREGQDEGFELAITGGTGDFENAGGTLTVRDLSETVELLTFEFSD